MEFILIFIGGAVLFAVISMATTSPGRSLQKKFIELGTLSGRTRSDIEACVGPPNAQSAIGEGKIILQWMATGYHIALIFGSDGICECVSHEFAGT